MLKRMIYIFPWPPAFSKTDVRSGPERAAGLFVNAALPLQPEETGLLLAHAQL
jgi:hypothetical protein